MAGISLLIFPLMLATFCKVFRTGSIIRASRGIQIPAVDVEGRNRGFAYLEMQSSSAADLPLNRLDRPRCRSTYWHWHSGIATFLVLNITFRASPVS